MTEKEKQEQQELQNKNQESSNTPPGCRFPSDPIEEDFFLSQVLGI